MHPPTTHTPATPLGPIPCARVFLALAACSLSAAAPSARADDEAVAISAKTSADYTRERMPDGTVKPETFAFAKGGVWKGTEGGTKDLIDFSQVARTIARPLAAEGYLPARDAPTTRLLLVVYWGTTRTPEHPTDSAGSQNLEIANEAALAANHPQAIHFNPGDSCAPTQFSQASTTSYAIRNPAQIDMDNAMSGAMAEVAAEDAQRMRIDALNASMLGYDTWWDATSDARGSALELRREDMISELEAHRYFVVLMAYDFQMLWRQKKAKLLWETRFSIREKGNDMSPQLAAMADAASRYFGRNSGRLVHERLPEGRVEVGPVTEVTLNQRN